MNREQILCWKAQMIIFTPLMICLVSYVITEPYGNNLNSELKEIIFEEYWLCWFCGFNHPFVWVLLWSKESIFPLVLWCKRSHSPVPERHRKPDLSQDVQKDFGRARNFNTALGPNLKIILPSYSKSYNLVQSYPLTPNIKNFW